MQVFAFFALPLPQVNVWPKKVPSAKSRNLAHEQSKLTRE